MYNVITLTELVIWFFIVATEFTMYANSNSTSRITIVTELFKIAGFEMTVAAEAVGIATCFILRVIFGSNALIAAIVTLTAQLSISTAILKYCITLD